MKINYWYVTIDLDDGRVERCGEPDYYGPDTPFSSEQEAFDWAAERAEDNLDDDDSEIVSHVERETVKSRVDHEEWDACSGSRFSRVIFETTTEVLA